MGKEKTWYYMKLDEQGEMVVKMQLYFWSFEHAF